MWWWCGGGDLCFDCGADDETIIVSVPRSALLLLNIMEPGGEAGDPDAQLSPPAPGPIFAGEEMCIAFSSDTGEVATPSPSLLRNPARDCE